MNLLDDGLIGLEDGLKIADFLGVPYAGDGAALVALYLTLEPNITPIVTGIRQFITQLHHESVAGAPPDTNDVAQLKTMIDSVAERHREVMLGEARP